MEKKIISDKLRESINKEELHFREAAKYLNIHPCYISMALNPNNWDGMSKAAWVRLEEWINSREAIKMFQIPEGEEIWKPINEGKNQTSVIRKPDIKKDIPKKVDNPINKVDSIPIKVLNDSIPITGNIRQKVVIDIEINLVINGQKIKL